MTTLDPDVKKKGRWAHKVKPIPKEKRYRWLRPDAKYASSRGQEYTIEQRDRGFWHINQRGGGRMNPKLKGRFTNFDVAERVLVSYLKRTSSCLGVIYPDKYK